MLYFIPTPIGNTEDITLRALKLFENLEYFFCEDTRTFRKLLDIYKINYVDKNFFSLTSFTDKSKLNKYLDLLKKYDIGLVSESGTPGLSDPGKILIEICEKNDINYTVLPGANALIPSVVGAGFDTSKFIYLGYMPSKKGRKTLINKIINDFEYPVFFYESVHRISKLINELDKNGFEGKISISREISKKFEQIFNGNFQEFLDYYKKGKIVEKGEFVIGLKNS